jgi:hypothetical protein
MARETREERNLRETAENAARFVEDTKDWTVRLMNVMVEYATLPGFDVRKYDNSYVEVAGPAVVLVPSEEVVGYDVTFVLPAVPASHDDVYNMEEAERMVKRYEEKAAEELRLYEVRTAALNKLNDEEKRLLGLK